MDELSIDNPVAKPKAEPADEEAPPEDGEDAEDEAEGEGGEECGSACALAWLDEQKIFLAVISVAFVVALLVYDTPKIAMWVGVAFAAYSAVANDSIQTLGILIAASKETKWYVLWAYVSAIFMATVGASWLMYDGDVSHQRLQAKGFDQAPTSFKYLQIAAPIFLLILTRLRMPVSTTFLLLSCFASSAKGFFSLVLKSVSGYVIAIVIGGGFWFVAGQKMQDTWHDEEGKPTEPHKLWLPLLWASAGFLWSVWLMQNAANIAVYLPRSLNWWEFLLFCSPIVGGLGVVMRMGGDKVQEVVEEKSGVSDIRGAAVVNIIYGGILFFFQNLSKVPMSTTFVFVGLLGGRELALCQKGISGLTLQEAGKLVVRDIVYVSIGFVVSIGLAAASNPVVADALV